MIICYKTQQVYSSRSWGSTLGLDFEGDLDRENQNIRPDKGDLIDLGVLSWNIEFHPSENLKTRYAAFDLANVFVTFYPNRERCTETVHLGLHGMDNTIHSQFCPRAT